MKKYILLIAILGILPFTILSQQKTDANIVGHVVNKSSDKHIPFINIGVKNTMIGTTTDGTGHFFLKNLPVGNITIQVSGMGYKTTERTISISVGQTLEVNFEVDEDIISLDEFIVSANRNESSRRDAAVVVGVMSSRQFQATNSTTLAQGLGFQPGIRVENNCQSCGFTQVRINGLEGPYSQILIDSRPIFSSLAGVYGLEQIPVNMIERVEIIRGGGSALFGANAIAGTINIITKEPLNNSFGIGQNLELIGGKSLDNSLNFNTSIVTDDHKAGLYLYATNRNRQFYDHNGDGFSEIPLLKNNTIGFRTYYRLSNQSKLTAEYHNLQEFRRGGNLFNLQPHETDITEQIKSDIHGGSLAFDWLSPDSWKKFSIYTSAQSVNRDSYYGLGKDPNAYGKTSSISSVTGAQFMRRFPDARPMPAELTMGAEINYEDLEDVITGYNRNITQRTTTAGFFLQNEWKNNSMNILLGGRIDKHSMLDKPIISPRANIKYNLTENLHIRATYSSGFRAPQAFDEDLHLDAVGGEIKMIRLVKGLKPENSNSFSLSADQYINKNGIEATLLAEAFYTNIENVFILTPLGVNTGGIYIMERTNGSGANVKGVNLEFKIIPIRKIQLQGGFTLQSSTYSEAEEWSDDPDIPAEKKMLRTPDKYGYFTLQTDVSPKLKLNLTATYTGSMLVPHFEGYIDSDRLEKTPEFFDMNIKASYDIKLTNVSYLELSAGVRNILNSYQSDFDSGKMRDSGYIYGPALPRTIFMGLRYRM